MADWICKGRAFCEDGSKILDERTSIEQLLNEMRLVYEVAVFKVGVAISKPLSICKIGST